MCSETWKNEGEDGRDTGVFDGLKVGGRRVSASRWSCWGAAVGREEKGLRWRSLTLLVIPQNGFSRFEGIPPRRILHVSGSRPDDPSHPISHLQ